MMLNYHEQVFVWDDLLVPMLVEHQVALEVESQNETPPGQFVPHRDIEEVLPTYLKPNEHSRLLKTLAAYGEVFLPDVGLVPGDPVNITLSNPKPIHLPPYPILHSLLQQAKDTVAKHVRASTITPSLSSEWAAPTFFIPKPNGELRMVTDFHQLNQQLIRHPHPLLKMEDIFQQLDGFDYVSMMDLSDGFYHFGLSKRMKKICTMVVPWGKYQYEQLPQGLKTSPDVFQHKMDRMFGDLGFVFVYIDDILIITKGNFEKHLTHLRLVLQCLKLTHLHVNLKKSKFISEEVKYLGFILSNKGICANLEKICSNSEIDNSKVPKRAPKFYWLMQFHLWHCESILRVHGSFD
jgi:Reverse transcriptase (RNA-dependent DNA polymerase)